MNLTRILDRISYHSCFIKISLHKIMRFMIQTCIPQHLAVSENALKIENEKLKEVTDIARNQMALFETRKRAESAELESLRGRLLEAEAAGGDERAQAGRLHRQIVAMQGREGRLRSVTVLLHVLFTGIRRKFNWKYD